MRAILAIVLILSLSLNAWAEQHQPKPLRVGFIGPFSGIGAQYGIAAKNGVELARGKAENSLLTMIYEDDQLIPTKTVSAFRRLKEVEKADVVFAIGSTCVHAIAPLAERSATPLLAWASDAGVSRNRDYVVRLDQSSEAQGATLAAEAVARGYKKTGFISTNSSFQQSIRTGFLKAYPPPHIVLDDEVPDDAADLRPFLLKAKARKVDSLGLCLQPGQHGLAAKQARDIGLRTPLFGCDNMQDSSDLKASEGALAGAWLVCQAVTDEFRRQYRKAFENDDVIAGAAVFYDAALLLEEAAQAGITSDKLVTWLLAAGKRSGATGDFTVVQENGDQFFKTKFAVMRVTETGLEPK